LIGKVNVLLSSVNTQKAMIEQQISDLCSNKYNELFYKHFIQRMVMNFYDSKLIKSQFIQNRTSILFDQTKRDKNNNINNGDSVYIHCG